MKRTASAHWNGKINEGKGEISTQSNTLNETQYSFKSRFENGVGTNPGELIGAAHAGCFTMAVSAALTPFFIGRSKYCFYFMCLYPMAIFMFY